MPIYKPERFLKHEHYETGTVVVEKLNPLNG